MSATAGTTGTRTLPTDPAAPIGPAATEWDLWSTGARLVVTDPQTLPAARALVDSTLAAVEQACSRFRRDSELMTLVRDPDGGAQLSPLLAELVAEALTAARQTDGALDPTLGSALIGIGYDRDIAVLRREGASRPAPVVVRRAPGWRSLRLEGGHLQMAPGTQLDLGATAKAGAADRCARLVHDRLGTGVLVSLGGDIATAGPGPEGGWQVTVQDLPDDLPQQVTLTPGAAVATSSTARRAWKQHGLPRHHLLDPRTGEPTRGPWRSVTAVAPSCLEANTLSTAAIVKGAQALPWLQRRGWPARLVPQHGRTVSLGGWPREVAVPQSTGASRAGSPSTAG
ncbi:MAG: FAD:protein transferase [Marmoricola sp.]|nr:FAD:protein transferase [Marmoricola sp.]